MLFAVYAATLGLNAFDGSDYAGDEPHQLLTAKSLVDDGDVDLTNQYRDGAYRSFYPRPLDPHGLLTRGRLNEPHGIGLPLLTAPAFWIGGAHGVELFIAALAAFAMVFAHRLALRVVPDPWALGATLAVGLSAPVLAYSTAVYPEMVAAAMLAGAALLALRVAERPSRPKAYACFGLLAMLPWLEPLFLVPGAAIAWFAFRALRRARRPVLAITALEVVGFSVALYVGLNEALFNGPTPYSAAVPGETGTDVSFPGGYLERSYRLIGLMIDRDYGLLRWAPVFVLAFVGAIVLWRERRSGLSRLLPGLRGDESAGLLCAAVVAGQLFVAVFLARDAFGFWFPARHLVAALPAVVPLVALGVRRAPRLGTMLALIGVAASLWLYLAVRLGDFGLVHRVPNAPWGPLERAFPLFAPGAAYPYVLSGIVAAAAAAWLAVDHWRAGHRTPAGTAE